MSKSALLLMDLQNGIVSRLANNTEYMLRMQNLGAAARKLSIPVIYVVVKFRENYPELSPLNKAFAMIKAGGFHFQEADDEVAIHESVAPQPGDLVVTKRRVGAFSGSDLEVVLRSQGINHIVLAGISTSGVVLSTLRMAADMDFKITVLSDCCLDRDDEVHRVLMEKVFPMQADVMKVEEWLNQC